MLSSVIFLQSEVKSDSSVCSFVWLKMVDHVKELIKKSLV